MKVADTNIIKGIKEFLSDIFPDVKDCLIDFSFGIDNVLKGKDQEKISFNFNFTINPDNFPGIFDEDDYLKKIKSGLSKRIGKKIRYLKVFWSFVEDKAEDEKLKNPCSMSFDVKF